MATMDPVIKFLEEAIELRKVELRTAALEAMTKYDEEWHTVCSCANVQRKQRS